MKFKYCLLASAVGAGILAAAPSASATIFDVTFTGVVSDGFDFSGMFGLRQAQLAGREFTATYRFDTAIGQEVIGGSEHGLDYASLGSSLTIGGHTVSVAGSYFSVIDFSRDTQHTHYEVSTRDLNADGSYEFDLENGIRADDFLPDPIVQPLDFTYSVYRVPTGQFYFANFSSDGTVVYDYAHGNLAANHMTLTIEGAAPDPQPDPGGVPEPGVWALMLMGFMGAGGMLRRRRCAVA
jgi:hypothetical protein